MAIGFGSSEGSASTDRIQTPLTTSSTQRTYAISAYRLGSGGGGLGRLMQKGGGEMIFFTDATDISFQQNFSGNDGKWRVPNPSDATWTRILLTYDSGLTSNDPVVYFDGVSQTVSEETEPTGTADTVGDALYIGSDATGVRAWDGWLAEATVWDRILTLAEIEADALFAPDTNLKDLVLYNPMVRGGTIDKIGGLCTVTGTAHQDHPRIVKPNIVPYMYLVGGTSTTLTAPTTATSGSSAALVGTGLNGTTINLIDSVNSKSREQTVTASAETTSTVNPVDTGEFDLRALGAGSSAIPGVPYSSVDVAAAGITPFTLKWEADDGGNPGVFGVDVSVGSGFTVVQLMTTGADAANTNIGESLASSAIVVIENNHQIVGPTSLNGMNLTYLANGDVVTDANQTETGLFLYYSPNTGNWDILELTINQFGVVSSGGIGVQGTYAPKSRLNIYR